MPRGKIFPTNKKETAMIQPSLDTRIRQAEREGNRQELNRLLEQAGRRSFRIIPLEICSDCLFFHANGDLPSPEHVNEQEFLAAIELNWSHEEGEEPWTISPGCEGPECEHAEWDEEPEHHQCEASFSWASCDSCDSSLGGDRYPARAHRWETQ